MIVFFLHHCVYLLYLQWGCPLSMCGMCAVKKY